MLQWSHITVSCLHQTDECEVAPDDRGSVQHLTQDSTRPVLRAAPERAISVGSMRTNLTVDDLGDLLEDPRLAVLATTRKDGTVLLSPIWFEWRDGAFQLWIEKERVKASHLRREPRCTIVVAEDRPPMRAIEVRGEGRFVEQDVTETGRRIAARYIGHEAAVAYAESMRGQDVVVRIKAHNVRVWDFADGVGVDD